MSDQPHPTIRATINDTPVETRVHPLTPLARILRDEFGLTGTKLACEAGDCGSCTVLLGTATDTVAVASCLIPLAHADGQYITTVEGLADDDSLHPVQAAMAAANASQCGFCIPGFVVTAAGLVADSRRRGGPPPDAETITRSLAGNLCRCTGYRQIIEAIGEAMSSDKAESDMTDDDAMAGTNQ